MVGVASPVSCSTTIASELATDCRRRSPELRGPETYTGKDLLTAHKGMNISGQEYIAAIDDVLSAMEKHGARQPERDDVVAILYSLKGQVIRV